MTTARLVKWPRAVGYGGTSPVPNVSASRLLTYRGTKYVYLPGSGQFNTPNDASLQITGDLELVYCGSAPWPTVEQTPLITKGQSYFFYIGNSKRVVLRITTASNFYFFTSDSFDNGVWSNEAIVWIKAEYDASATIVNFYYSLEPPTVNEADVTWIAFGGSTIAEATSIDVDGSSLLFARPDGLGSATDPMTFYRAIIKDGIGGTPVLDVNIDAAADLSEPFDSFTETTGKTVNIDRATSGPVTTVVDRSMWVHDGDTKFIELLDRDELDFGANDDLTLVAQARTEDSFDGQTRVLFASNNITNIPGYQLYKSSGNVIVARTHDGDLTSVDIVSISPDRVAFTAAMTRDALGSETEAWIDGVGSGTPSTTSQGSLSNDTNLAIGRQGNTASGFWWGSIHWVALFRSRLTDARMLELAAWDGSIANEPSWLRGAAVFYINADDPIQQAAYREHNELVNLADDPVLVIGETRPGILNGRQIAA